MKRTSCLAVPLCLLLTACVPADAPVAASSSEAASAVLPADAPEEADAGWKEQINIDEDYVACLRDGTPFPQQTLPLYYKGNWQGKTWAQLAEETGLAEADLRALNPQVKEGTDGALSGAAPDLLLSEAYAIPRTEEALVTISVSSMPEAYQQRSYQVPASLPRGAATVLALAYYNAEAEGQGFTCEPVEIGDYRQVMDGVRFTTFSQAEHYFSAIYTEDALQTLVEPRPWHGDAPAAYYAEGDGDALLIQGYPFDSLVPQSGYTHTEPEEQPDGSLKFAGICVVVTDEEGKPLPEGTGRLYYAPTVLVETEDGWRVETADPPF